MVSGQRWVSAIVCDKFQTLLYASVLPPSTITAGDWLDLDHSNALGLSEFKAWWLQAV